MNETRIPPQTIEKAVRAAITRRRSTRVGYTSKPISFDALFELVQAGIHAPTGANAQDVRFLILTKPKDIARVGRARFCWPYRSTSDIQTKHPTGIIGNAKTLILVFVDRNVKGDWGGKPYWQFISSQSAAASIQNILLLATTKGLASCWVAAFPAMERTDSLAGDWVDVLDPFDIPDSWEIQGIIMLGYHDRPYQGESEHGGKPVKREGVKHYSIWR